MANPIKEFLAQQFPNTKPEQWKFNFRKPLGKTILNGYENTETSEIQFVFEVDGKFTLTNDVSTNPRRF